MINNLKTFYTLNSNPLAIPEEINVDYIYANEHGDIIKIVDIKKVIESDNIAIDYNIVQKSELVDGELIADLDTKLLSLFWKLTRNNASKTTPYEDDTNKDQ